LISFIFTTLLKTEAFCNFLGKKKFNQKGSCIQIKVRLFGPLVSLAKVKSLNFEFTKNYISIKELIFNLSKSFGTQFKNYVLKNDENKIKSFILILVNDISIDLLDNLNTKLKNNDIITFLPSIHGG